jgi:hypothetical protein
VSVLMHHSMVRSHVAYRFYCPESIYMGPAWSVHSVDSAVFIELHLERDPSLEWWKIGHVSSLASVEEMLGVRLAAESLASNVIAAYASPQSGHPSKTFPIR